jgi:hypothetical protein
MKPDELNPRGSCIHLSDMEWQGTNHHGQGIIGYLTYIQRGSKSIKSRGLPPPVGGKDPSAEKISGGKGVGL